MDENREPSKVREEFDRLYLEYRQKLQRLVLTKIKDPYLAEEVVQEIFYEAWRHYAVVSVHESQEGWLYQTAWYKIKEFMRRIMQCSESSMDAERVEMSVEEEGFDKAELDLMIYEILTPDELLRFHRYFLWGETTAEMAKKEAITENNMRVRISRLKKKIESALKDKAQGDGFR